MLAFLSAQASLEAAKLIERKLLTIHILLTSGRQLNNQWTDLTRSLSKKINLKKIKILHHD